MFTIVAPRKIWRIAPREATPSSSATAAQGRVSFVRSARVADNDGKPLLLQAEQHGLSPQCGCRMGICHTCLCSLESGAVKNLQTGEITDQAGAMIQICVSAPVGDVSVDL
ncbi:MAG: 2Fe-2S iron-sulfur cluster binding domain-containing protein [Deltaproteobacteria bacterium]|nr:2Fe-2S iron-sulfur cluster binding domain-containing protein [Deltaproteobacteria bacterium]MBW2189010.1 2Fe-2S iron-sulfur cluster binding domain-containing protein [Deltaproteobacteria bacterium]MBW2223482.1 2Fe-2S iron-sulfur cluster binding domain-containing protein [Deltaproteobacteria bacterium]MBW2403076.1 2Fe-2S iron-sulfur cluster binding domain-containing protein [Deltaproteobacteria bacterium]MBW2547092.1 2Fe-2S iron-sulfur cluster binding domain-containing protein [Deltaproteobac